MELNEIIHCEDPLEWVPNYKSAGYLWRIPNGDGAFWCPNCARMLRTSDLREYVELIARIFTTLVFGNMRRR